MSAPKFTPGPWKSAWVEVGSSQDDEEVGGFLIWPASMNSLEALMSNSAVANAFFGEEMQGDAEAEANATLIAAAPDLFEALKWFIDDIDGRRTKMVDFDKNVARGRAALAKAQGR